MFRPSLLFFRRLTRSPDGRKKATNCRRLLGSWQELYQFVYFGEKYERSTKNTTRHEGHEGTNDTKTNMNDTKDAINSR
ncbi:hypothetical protein [Terrimonas alba]|uniref:hypothetical protein n=1 Tax=Terrimonas alba TaxID=3349636 RepID=UPI0035F2D5B4